MRLLRVGAPGATRPAVLADDGRVLDVSSGVSDYDERFFGSGGIGRLRALLSGERLPEIDLEHERVAACVARPSQVLCIGLNYRDHAQEVGADLPEEPIVFNKAPSTVVGPYDDVLLPPGAAEVDWEVELGVVIGRTARYLPSVEEARAHIAGYCISNDVSERFAQLRRGGQWVKGKSFETFNPCGPWLVTADEVDPSDLELTLTVDGEVMQSSSTKQLIFDTDYLVWYLSQFMVLLPGDLINTGTPGGVGMSRQPPRFLESGNVVELAITGLGTQRQRCVPATVPG